MIDFRQNNTELLLNPRTPPEEGKALNDMVASKETPRGLVWLLTSGSSGAKKLAGLTRNAILESAEAVNVHLQARSSDVWLLALPGFHVGGLGVYARGYLSGAKIIAPFLKERWSALEFLSAAIKEQITLSALVPTQVFDLVELKTKCPETVRAIVVGGGPLDFELYEKARKLSYPLLPSYGLTECASQVATAKLDSVNASISVKQHPPIVCLDHVEVKTLKNGCLAIKSNALFSGYLSLRDGRPFFDDPKQDGWFESDDLGVVQERCVFVQGRADKIIKISGETVDINRLDILFEKLRRSLFPEFDAALIATQDERLQNHITMLAPRPLGTERAKSLCDAFNREVMPFERIRSISLVDEIPRSELNKHLPLKH